MTTKSITLHSGDKMPVMGLGTFLSKDPEQVYDNVKTAILEYGYRHIDTAALYGNEEAVGRAIKDVIETGIKREELFITTKLWRTEMEEDKILPAFHQSLEKLGLEYIDLYLIHSTMPYFDYEADPPVAKSLSME